MPNSKTVLVTGSSGFIAKHVVLQLLNAGYDVVGSVRSEKRIDEVKNAVRPHLATAGDLDSRLRFVTLDLLSDDGWADAMTDVDVLMHTASPFPMAQPDDEYELVRPAVDGTRRAMKAAFAAGISRVVVTSSVAAIMHGSLRPGRDTYDEEDWSDVSSPAATPYVKSKTLAERAAWDFVRTEAPDLQLTTINPALVLGRPLDDNYGTSLQVVERILKARDPMLPNFGFSVVDVTDIARMHVAALEKPEAVGKRFVGAESFVWYIEMAGILKAAFPDRRIYTRRAPDFVVHFLSIFDKSIKSILPGLGKREEVDNKRARDILGIGFIPAADSVRAAGGYIVGRGLV